MFEKARTHERLEILRAARAADLLPYFRVMESAARPVVEMEGAARIMLGGNNYLGLTEDERVIAGARDALERYVGEWSQRNGIAAHLQADGVDLPHPGTRYELFCIVREALENVERHAGATKVQVCAARIV